MDTPVKDHTSSNPDLFTNFLQAESTSESDAVLEVLFENVVVPAVSNVIKHKMNVSLSANDTSARNLDALELVSDVEAELLRKFRSLRGELHREERITNPEAYSRAVATNAFRQHLRNKYPQRRRLRNKIRYIFRNKQGYALWQVDDGGYVCGTEEWKKTNRPPIRIGFATQFQALIESPGWDSNDADDNRRILAVLKQLLRLADAPVGLDQTVNIVADVLGLADAYEVGVSDDIAMDGGGLEDRLFDRWSLDEFWREIALLPLRHRTALLLNLRGEHGENISALFPMLRIVSIRKIAEALQVSHEELAEIWYRLPLDDQAIAERLGVTRQQVINLRQSARSNLKRKKTAKE